MHGVSLSKEQFFNDLYLFIDLEANQLKGDKNYLTYSEVQKLTGKVRLKIQKLSGIIPKQISLACSFAQAIMAPTKKAKIEILKNIALQAGGITGIALIIAALAPVLGWGAGFNAAILGFFAGIQVAPIIGQIAGGSFILVMVSYFCFYKEPPEVTTDKCITALKKQIQNVENIVWKTMTKGGSKDDFWFDGEW